MCKRFFFPSSDDFEILHQIAYIDKQAFGHDGITAFNLSQLARCKSVLVLEVNKIIVGQSVIIKNNYDDGALVFGFAIQREQHNKGYGKALLSELIKSFKKTCSYLELTMNPENPALKRLYIENGGFKFKKSLQPHPLSGEPRWLVRLDF